MDDSSAHLLPIRVYWEDTDAGGIVYHASWLRFLERGRTEMLRCAGIDQRALRDEHGLSFVVARLSIAFRRPGLHDQALVIETRIERAGASRLDLAQRALHEGEALVEAQVRCALIGGDGRPRAAPPAIREALARLHPMQPGDTPAPTG